VPVGAYEDFPGAGGYPDGRLWACVVEVGDGKGGVAGDAFAGAEWPCEEDAVERGGRCFGDGSEGRFWGFLAYYVCGQCAVAVFWAVP
jgi:hypothetical protein